MALEKKETAAGMVTFVNSGRNRWKTLDCTSCLEAAWLLSLAGDAGVVYFQNIVLGQLPTYGQNFKIETVAGRLQDMQDSVFGKCVQKRAMTELTSAATELAKLQVFSPPDVGKMRGESNFMKSVLERFEHFLKCKDTLGGRTTGKKAVPLLLDEARHRGRENRLTQDFMRLFTAYEWLLSAEDKNMIDDLLRNGMGSAGGAWASSSQAPAAAAASRKRQFRAAEPAEDRRSAKKKGNADEAEAALNDLINGCCL